MINILVSFDNSDFTQTRINATLEEAKQYYIGNYFTFGTCAENEYKAKAVNVVLFDEWKLKVLEFCMENNNTVLKFDDELKVLYFACSLGHNHMCTYDDVNRNMEAPKGWTYGDLYGNGWDKPIYTTKEEAIRAAKENFKNTNGRFIEIGWCILKNNQLNVVNCERLEF